MFLELFSGMRSIQTKSSTLVPFQAVNLKAPNGFPAKCFEAAFFKEYLSKQAGWRGIFNAANFEFREAICVQIKYVIQRKKSIKSLKYNN